MFEDKMSSQIVEDEKKPPSISINCSSDETANGESNEIFGCRDDSIPINPLLVLKGKFNGIPVKILKDDGCNTNVISRTFVKKYKNLFHVVNKKMIVNHSCEGQSEEVTQVVLNGNLTLGNHLYISNFVVASCRYDILLGMPWHVTHEPKISYAARVVRVADKCVPVQREEQVDAEAKIENLNVTSFRKLLKRRNNKNYFKVYQVIDVNTMTGDNPFEGEGQVKNPNLKRILEKYKDVFRTGLLRDCRPSGQSIMRLKQNPRKSHRIARLTSYRQLNFELRRNILSTS
jgi:Retroviral aspartyl protease